MGCRMRRRTAITGLVALLTTPEHPAAQQPSGKIPHVGILTPGNNERTQGIDAFREGLRDLGSLASVCSCCARPSQITAVSALVNPRQGNSNSFFEKTAAAARSLGLEDLRRVWAESAAALRALSPTAFSGAGGVVVQPRPLSTGPTFRPFASASIRSATSRFKWDRRASFPS